MRNNRLPLRELVVFALLGTLMFCSKILMEFLPNIHLLGTLTMVYTVVFRKKALIPIYVYVVMNGVYAGFSFWWVPYLYIWTVLWGITMLLPRKMSPRIAWIVYPCVCAVHGFLFGVLYAPAQALMFGYDFPTTLKWIAAGFYFDVLHAAGNLGMGLIVYPLSQVLIKLNKRAGLN